MKYIDELVEVISKALPEDVRIENVQAMGDTRTILTVSREVGRNDIDVTLDDFENNTAKPEVCDKIVNDFAKNIGDLLSSVNLVDSEVQVTPTGFGGGIHLEFVDGDEFSADSDLKVLAEILVFDPGEILNDVGDGAPAAADDTKFSADDLDPDADVEIEDATPVAVEDTDESEADADEPRDEYDFSESVNFKALAEKYLGPDDPDEEWETKSVSDDEEEEILSAKYKDWSDAMLDDNDPWEDTLDYTNVKKESIQEAFEVYDCFNNDSELPSVHEGDCLDMISADPTQGYVDPTSGEPCNQVEPSTETEEPVHMVDTARGQEIEKHTKKEDKEKLH